ncbi:hypothetical protein JM93_01891 [Roseibium hamelinense]|uniref:Uncharacterized protein n=1 Tax=Roseibium hamelinense TaxID=150831 RepID=A0A562T7T3_9HYPH|nr:hypothetical protein JM93_01891 [Roseibium hamelinense]
MKKRRTGRSGTFLNPGNAGLGGCAVTGCNAGRVCCGAMLAGDCFAVPGKQGTDEADESFRAQAAGAVVISGHQVRGQDCACHWLGLRLR